MKYCAGFIGVGNMGGALFDAVSRTAASDLLSVYDKNTQKATEKNAEFKNIDVVVRESKFVFLGVKPNVIFLVADEIKKYINDETVIVSMAAGIDLASLESALETDRIIRIMPNTPVSTGNGVILYCASKGVSSNDIDLFLKLLSSLFFDMFMLV